MSSGNVTQNAVREALTNRRYNFATHGQSFRWFGSQRRQGVGRPRRRSQRRSQPYLPVNPNDFQLGKFAQPERLHAVFRILESEGGEGAGEDELTYDNFDPSALYASLRQLSASLGYQTYLPYPTRLVRIPKSGNRRRELQLQRILDRVVAKALQIALDGYWRSQLPGIGRDVWQLYAQMQRAMREHRTYVLAIDDIENCFPTAPIAQVISCHHQHISQPDLLWLIETIVRGHEGPAHTTGLYQGSPYSPVAMELLLHTHLDTLLEARYQGFPLLLRYVDNLTYLCRNEHESYQVLQVTEAILAELGLHLKREDGPPRDIRDRSSNQAVLGLIPQWKNGQLVFSIPEGAFGDLREGFNQALLTPHPFKVAKAVAEGWLNSLGPALVSKVVRSIVERVIITARDCGFSELIRRDLLEIAQQARNRWLVMSESGGCHG